jgi:hypothetical protein
VTRVGPVALLLLLLAGCGASKPTGPAVVGVAVGPQDVKVRPVQYCLNGQGQRYTNTPPIIEVSPDATIALTVPADVAARGWSVQVFDEKLKDKLGTVDVDKGTTVFEGINTSDIVPPAFYLVVVEGKGGDCGEFSGAWPIGFLRAGGNLGGTPSSSAPPAG